MQVKLGEMISRLVLTWCGQGKRARGGGEKNEGVIRRDKSEREDQDGWREEKGKGGGERIATKIKRGG